MYLQDFAYFPGYIFVIRLFIFAYRWFLKDFKRIISAKIHTFTVEPGHRIWQLMQKLLGKPTTRNCPQVIGQFCHWEFTALLYTYRSEDDVSRQYVKSMDAICDDIRMCSWDFYRFLVYERDLREIICWHDYFIFYRKHSHGEQMELQNPKF